MKKGAFIVEKCDQEWLKKGASGDGFRRPRMDRLSRGQYGIAQRREEGLPAGGAGRSWLLARLGQMFSASVYVSLADP